MPIVVQPDNKKKITANSLNLFIFYVLPELILTLQPTPAKIPSRAGLVPEHTICVWAILDIGN